MSTRIRLLRPALVALLGLPLALIAADPVHDVFNPHPDMSRTVDGKWKLHDMDRPHPPRAEPKPAAALATAAQAPAGAVQLFDGKDFSHWVVPPSKWQAVDGEMRIVPGGDTIRTKESFGSIRLHLEWRTPAAPTKKGQDRGNSGVFLMSTYEIQVLDTYDNPTYADGIAAALYGMEVPKFNALRPSGEWQFYDIWFQRPIFDASGRMTRPARVTVDVNGVRVHENVPFHGASTYHPRLPYRAHADQLPFSLQYHSEEVHFRNIWVQPLADTAAAPHEAQAQP